MTQYQMFNDSRWLKRRDELLAAADWTCQECSADVEAEGVHVCYYPKGQLLWEYPDALFRVLCPDCRARRRHLERELKEMLPSFPSSELGVFVDLLEKLQEFEPPERARAMEELRAAIKKAAQFDDQLWERLRSGHTTTG